MALIGLEPTVWFPVVTLVVGFVGKGMLDARADSRIAERDRVSRREVIVAAAKLRRIEFQRATLLATQDALLAAMRSITTIHLHDAMNRGAPGGWGSVLADEGAANVQREDMATLARHRVRVRDDEIRKQLDEFASLCTAIGMARSEEQGYAALSKAVKMSIVLNERIGDLLRTLDEQEDAATV